MAKMIEYCIGDVELLERVYIKMVPHFAPITHYGVKNGGVKTDCPRCGSSNTKIVQHRISATGVKRVQTQCKNCGGYHTRPLK
jgi:ribosomal protein S27AE